MAHSHDHKKLSDDPIVRGHETSDVDPKSVFVSGLVISIGLTVVGMLIAWGAYIAFKSQATVPGGSPRTFVVPDEGKLPPAPRLQADPHVSLVPFIQNQDSVLASFGWVNKDSGIAKIPIERAMKIVVQQGLPTEAR